MIPAAWKEKAPRLKTIAKWINENTRLDAEVHQTHYSTDVKHGRIRFPRKGRWGNRLKVWDESGDEIIDHNAAETYRSNDEVVDQLERYLKDHPKAARR